MKVLTRTKSLVFIIVLLLITNLVLLGFFILKNPHEKKMNPNREKGSMYTALQTEVGFSESQLKEYQQLRKDQFQNLKPLFNNVRISKEKFYNLLYQENPSDSLVKVSADSIGYHQKLLDLQMLNYFKRIRQTCTPGQLPKFDTAMKKNLQRMTGRPGKNKP